MDLRLTPDQEELRQTVHAWLQINLPAGWGTDIYLPPTTLFRRHV